MPPKPQTSLKSPIGFRSKKTKLAPTAKSPPPASLPKPPNNGGVPNLESRFSQLSDRLRNSKLGKRLYPNLQSRFDRLADRLYNSDFGRRHRRMIPILNTRPRLLVFFSVYLLGPPYLWYRSALDRDLPAEVRAKLPTWFSRAGGTEKCMEQEAEREAQKMNQQNWMDFTGLVYRRRDDVHPLIMLVTQRPFL